jgi:hypothetical protein
MLKQVRNVASCLVALSLSIVACGDGDDEGNMSSGGSGGKGGSSGSTGKGGASGSGTGGTAGKGGSAGTAGSAGSGGAAGSTAGSGTTGGSAGEGEGGSSGEVNNAGNAGSSQGGGSAGEGEGGEPGSGGTGGDGASGTPGAGAGGEPAGVGGEGGHGLGGEAGAPMAGGVGGEGGAPPVPPDVIDNPSFETTPDGVLLPPWLRTAAVEAHLPAATYSWSDAGGAQAGNGFLDLWLDTPYTVTVSQTVMPLPAGSYTLSIWHQGGAYIDQYVFVRGYDASSDVAELKVTTAASAPYVQLTIPNIPVTSGEIEIGIYSNGDTGAWSHFDNVTLTLVTP